MQSTIKKMRSPLKWHGGKSYLARRIVALMPDHSAYVEPFVGGGSVLLNRPESGREVAGDLNASLILFWRQMQQRRSELPGLMAGVKYCEEEFRAADGLLMAEHPTVRAGAFLIRNRFSRGGLGKDFAWSDRLRNGQPGDVNAWDTIRDELPAIAERVRDVEFVWQPAIETIRENDGPDTLIYCDPPYCPETRTVPKAYAHEMTREDHADLLTTLLACRGKVMLSGYGCGLYDDALGHWRRVEWDLPNHSGQGKSKQRRTECLWMNFGS